MAECKFKAGIFVTIFVLLINIYGASSHATPIRPQEAASRIFEVRENLRIKNLQDAVRTRRNGAVLQANPNAPRGPYYSKGGGNLVGNSAYGLSYASMSQENRATYFEALTKKYNSFGFDAVNKHPSSSGLNSFVGGQLGLGPTLMLSPQANYGSYRMPGGYGYHGSFHGYGPGVGYGSLDGYGSHGPDSVGELEGPDNFPMSYSEFGSEMAPGASNKQALDAVPHTEQPGGYLQSTGLQTEPRGPGNNVSPDHVNRISEAKHELLAPTNDVEKNHFKGEPPTAPSDMSSKLPPVARSQELRVQPNHQDEKPVTTETQPESRKKQEGPTPDTVLADNIASHAPNKHEITTASPAMIVVTDQAKEV